MKAARFIQLPKQYILIGPKLSGALTLCGSIPVNTVIVKNQIGLLAIIYITCPKVAPRYGKGDDEFCNVYTCLSTKPFCSCFNPVLSAASANSYHTHLLSGAGPGSYILIIHRRIQCFLAVPDFFLSNLTEYSDCHRITLYL